MVIEVEGNSERVRLSIEWAGGSCTQLTMTRHVYKYEQLSFYPQLTQQLRTLANAGTEPHLIAEKLNQLGYHPPKQTQQFSRTSVLRLMDKLGLSKRPSPPNYREGLEPMEWWLPELARKLDMPKGSLHGWIQRGKLSARQQSHHPYRWVIWADDAEIERLQQLRQTANHPLPVQCWLGDVNTSSGKQLAPE